MTLGSKDPLPIDNDIRGPRPTTLLVQAGRRKQNLRFKISDLRRKTNKWKKPAGHGGGKCGIRVCFEENHA